MGAPPCWPFRLPTTFQGPQRPSSPQEARLTPVDFGGRAHGRSVPHRWLLCSAHLRGRHCWDGLPAGRELDVLRGVLWGHTAARGRCPRLLRWAGVTPSSCARSGRAPASGCTVPWRPSGVFLHSELGLRAVTRVVPDAQGGRPRPPPADPQGGVHPAPSTDPEGGRLSLHVGLSRRPGSACPVSDSGPSVPVAAGSPDPWNHDWTRGLFRARLYSALLPHECVCLCWGPPSTCGEFLPRPCGVPWQRRLGTQRLLSLLCPILALCPESGAAHGLELFARPAFGPRCWSRLPPRWTVAGVRGAVGAVDSFLSGELSLWGCIRKGRDLASPLPLWVPGPCAHSACGCGGQASPRTLARPSLSRGFPGTRLLGLDSAGRADS